MNLKFTYRLYLTGEKMIRYRDLLQSILVDEVKSKEVYNVDKYKQTVPEYYLCFAQYLFTFKCV